MHKNAITLDDNMWTSHLQLRRVGIGMHMKGNISARRRIANKVYVARFVHSPVPRSTKPKHAGHRLHESQHHSHNLLDHYIRKKLFQPLHPRYQNAALGSAAIWQPHCLVTKYQF